MSKIPKKPEDIFQEFTEDYRSVLGDDLLSIILYGSGAKGDYVYKKSDINFALIVTEHGINRLRECLPLIKKYRKRKVTTPLFLTLEYIERSLDSYPVEFFNMKNNHQLVYGEDLFSGLVIDKQFLRLQSERELKGKLLHLREAYLSTAHKKKLMKQLISNSIISFSSIFNVLLNLKDADSSTHTRDIFLKTAQIYNLDQILFNKLLSVRQNSNDPSKEELYDLLEKYIIEIQKLTNLIDKL
ncbi:hypothetical protein JXB12_01560 [candidate division KSB1 bacterium]|nr:hypothetical protein [candidate division KSB1 bacterium]